MQCPFCAETIQDAAILCRFCGAAKEGEVWHAPVHNLPPAMPSTPTAHKATFTIRFAAFFFLLSALFELFALSSPIPLFGAVRGGVVAVLYHLVYIGVFISMGVALWQAYAVGYRIALIGTIVYTLIKVAYILDFGAREAEIADELNAFGELEGMVDSGSILLLTNLAAIVTVLCWWGFILYLRYHRSYFASDSIPQ